MLGKKCSCHYTIYHYTIYHYTTVKFVTFCSIYFMKQQVSRKVPFKKKKKIMVGTVWPPPDHVLLTFVQQTDLVGLQLFFSFPLVALTHRGGVHAGWRRGCVDGNWYQWVASWWCLHLNDGSPEKLHITNTYCIMNTTCCYPEARPHDPEDRDPHDPSLPTHKHIMYVF